MKNLRIIGLSVNLMMQNGLRSKLHLVLHREYLNINTPWTKENSDIYIRRHFVLTKEDLKHDLWMIFSHDDKCEIYVNGISVIETGETWIQNEEIRLSDEVKKGLRVGDNTIAYHVHNTKGGANADIGMFVDVKAKKTRNIENDYSNELRCNGY